MFWWIFFRNYFPCFNRVLALMYLQYSRGMRGQLQRKWSSKSIVSILAHWQVICLPMTVPFLSWYRSKSEIVLCEDKAGECGGNRHSDLIRINVLFWLATDLQKAWGSFKLKHLAVDFGWCYYLLYLVRNMLHPILCHSMSSNACFIMP